MGPRSCTTDSIPFLAGWHKRQPESGFILIGFSLACVGSLCCCHVVVVTFDDANDWSGRSFICISQKWLAGKVWSQTWLAVSEMTYNVSSGMLNPVPCCTISVWHIILYSDSADTKKILTTSPVEEWKRPEDHIGWSSQCGSEPATLEAAGYRSSHWLKQWTWLRTSHSEAVNVAQNQPLWRLLAVATSGTVQSCDLVSYSDWTGASVVVVVVVSGMQLRFS